MPYPSFIQVPTTVMWKPYCQLCFSSHMCIDISIVVYYSLTPELDRNYAAHAFPLCSSELPTFDHYSRAFHSCIFSAPKIEPESILCGTLWNAAIVSATFMLRCVSLKIDLYPQKLWEFDDFVVPQTSQKIDNWAFCDTSTVRRKPNTVLFRWLYAVYETELSV